MNAHIMMEPALYATYVIKSSHKNKLSRGIWLHMMKIKVNLSSANFLVAAKDSPSSPIAGDICIIMTLIALDIRAQSAAKITCVKGTWNSMWECTWTKKIKLDSNVHSRAVLPIQVINQISNHTVRISMGNSWHLYTRSEKFNLNF